MNKATIDFQQFSLAPRRKLAVRESDEALLEVCNNPETGERASEPSEQQTVLPRLPDEEKRRRGTKRAVEQDDARRRLKSLKRAKDRTLKFYVNVPLEQAMKARLMRAAHENDVKMTVIMQAAIDTYLEDNGY